MSRDHRPNRRPVAELEAELTGLFAESTPPTLDRVAAAIAGLSDEPVTAESVVGRLDALAEQAPADSADADSVLAHVFGNLGFEGNRRDYYTPDNSYLHRVIETRLGIPITLAVVAIEVGRRLGVPLTPVGFPSHFLIGDGARRGRWFDPFEAGRALDTAACQELLSRVHPGAALDPSHFAALAPAEVAHRMLNNLRHIHLTLGDLTRATAVAQLSLALPGAGMDHRREYIRLLVATGRYEDAAEQHEMLAGLDPASDADHRRAARRLRAHLN